MCLPHGACRGCTFSQGPGASVGTQAEPRSRHIWDAKWTSLLLEWAVKLPGTSPVTLFGQDVKMQPKQYFHNFSWLVPVLCTALVPAVQCTSAHFSSALLRRMGMMRDDWASPAGLLGPHRNSPQYEKTCLKERPSF